MSTGHPHARRAAGRGKRFLRPLFRRPVLGSPRARRHVLHGDWHPLVRDSIDLLRLHYLAAAAVFFALGRFHAAWGWPSWRRRSA
jgi:hypothetical protein